MNECDKNSNSSIASYMIFYLTELHQMQVTCIEINSSLPSEINNGNREQQQQQLQ